MKTPSMIPPSRAEAGSSGASPSGRTGLAAAREGKRFSVRDIFREHYPEYAMAHDIPFHKRKVMEALMACGTGELGYTVSECRECHETQIHADTCGNRNCPSCGLVRQLRWRALREAELVYGIPYFHVVFTLPHGLTDLIGQNQKPLLDLLFQSSARSVSSLCLEKHGMVPGILMVLHTCGGNLLPHYHIHMLVSGGGLTPDKSSFVRLREGAFFLPAKLLAARYRGLFMSSMERMHGDGELSFDGYAQKYRNSFEWKELVKKCCGTDWNVEIRAYPPCHEPRTAGNVPGTPSNTAGVFADYAMEKPASPERVSASHGTPGSGGPDGDADRGPGIAGVCQYLSQYTNCTAVTDTRILSCGEQHVTIECKVHHRGGYTTKEPLKLTAGEFIRRFLLNILPERFSRIRYSGFLAGCVKNSNLALIRELLEQEQPPKPTLEMKAAELVIFFYGVDFSKCPACGGRMDITDRRLRESEAVGKIIRSCRTRAS